MSEVNAVEVTAVKPLSDVPEEERVSTLAASGEYPYILILEKKSEEDGEVRLTLDISNDYLKDEEGRGRLREILSTLADNI